MPASEGIPSKKGKTFLDLFDPSTPPSAHEGTPPSVALVLTCWVAFSRVSVSNPTLRNPVYRLNSNGLRVWRQGSVESGAILSGSFPPARDRKAQVGSISGFIDSRNRPTCASNLPFPPPRLLFTLEFLQSAESTPIVPDLGRVQNFPTDCRGARPGRPRYG